MKERIVILADKKFGPITSKMGNSVIRFAEEKVVAVIDRSKAGKVVNDVLEYHLRVVRYPLTGTHGLLRHFKTNYIL